MSAPVAIVLGLGIFASVALAQFVQQSEMRRTKNEFRIAADHAVNSIRDKIDGQIELIRSVASFFHSSALIERSEFQNFVSDSLERHTSIQSVGWAPRVRAADRATFERTVREKGFLAEFQINERNANRQPTPAGRRDEYFPTLYLMPAPDNVATYGLDQASDPVRRAAMDLARDTGEMILSEHIQLALATEHRTAILSFVPVYKTGRKPQTLQEKRRDLIGYALGVIRPSRIVEELSRARAYAPNREINSAFRIEVFDVTESLKPVFLFDYNEGPADVRAPQPAGMTIGLRDVVTTLSFGTRSWTFIAKPASADTAAQFSWPTMLTFLGLLALTLLASAYIHTGIGRRRAVERQVATRTSELQYANEMLRDSQDRIQAIANAVPALIAYVDHDMIYRFVNDRYRQIGLDPEQMIGRHASETRDPAGYERIRPYFERAAKGEKISFEIQSADIDGQPRHSVVQCQPDFRDDEVRGFYVLGLDVTAQREAEAEAKRSQELLAESEHRLRSITNSVPALIAYIDKDLVYRFANERYRDIGIDPAVIIGQRIRDRLGAGAYEIIEPYFRRAARGEAVEFEITPTTRDGTIRHRRISCTPDIVAGEVRGFYLLGNDITELRKAEESLRIANQRLRDSEDRIHTIADSVPAMIAYVDSDLVFQFANERYRDIGIDPEALIGKPFENRLNDGSYEIIRPYFERAANGEAVSFEVATLSGDGRRQYRTMTCTPDTRDGKVRGFYVFGQDVTAQRESDDDLKRAHELLRGSEERLRVITNSLPALIAHVDRDMRIRYMNERFSLLAPDAGDATGQRFDTVVGTRRFENLRIACERALGAGESSQIELQVVTKDGRQIVVLADITPDRTETGKIAGFYFVALNVTQQRAVEIELDRFFRQSLSFMCVASFDGYLHRFNDTWTSALGYSYDDLISTPYMTLIHPDDREKAETAISQLIGGGEVMNLEVRMIAKRGEPRWVLWNAAANMHERQIYATGHDITDLKAIDQMKDEFVSTVSHELRTPLTSIKGALGLMRAKALGIGSLPAELNSILDIAYSNCDRLIALINDILDIEKIEAGKMEFKFAPIDIEAAIQSSIDANQAYAAQFGVEIVRASDPLHVIVRADEGRLMQVMANLLSNAVKFSPEGERVEVAIEQESSTVRISVRDHGPGIPEDFRPKIFQKFSQNDSSDRRKVNGTGLGLSIVSAILDRHGGRIDFDTELGKGSTFHFDLPLADSATAPTGNA